MLLVSLLQKNRSEVGLPPLEGSCNAATASAPRDCEGNVSVTASGAKADAFCHFLPGKEITPNAMEIHSALPSNSETEEGLSNEGRHKVSLMRTADQRLHETGQGLANDISPVQSTEGARSKVRIVLGVDEASKWDSNCSLPSNQGNKIGGVGCPATDTFTTASRPSADHFNTVAQDSGVVITQSAMAIGTCSSDIWFE
jgi:hypothetical protein